jgi:aspartyl-tRNA(Asn)/glutamyl-tRNA(Gln) amidotransferase subunit A
LPDGLTTEPQLPLEGLLVGVFESWLRHLPCSHPLSKVLDHLDNQNCRLVLLKSDVEEEEEQVLETYYKIASMEASSTLARYTGMFWNDRRFVLPQIEAKNYADRVFKFQEENFSEEVLRRVREGRNLLTDPVAPDKAHRARNQIKEAYKTVLQRDCDLIIGPTAFDSAPSLLKSFEAERSDDIFTVVANLADLPAISLPLHRASPAAVIGTQLMCLNRSDLFLLRAARSLEESFFTA